MIAVDNLSIRQGDFLLDGVSLELSDGEYGVLMGRSGCGKTTVLEAICGLRPIIGGRILLGGRDVSVLPPAERHWLCSSRWSFVSRYAGLGAVGILNAHSKNTKIKWRLVFEN